MANRIKIVLPGQPTNFQQMNLSVESSALGYSSDIQITFKTGTITDSNQVMIGADLNATMNNLLIALNYCFLDGFKSFELGTTPGVLYINFRVPGTYSCTDLIDGSALTITTESVTLLEPIELPALNLKHVSIRIYDTYKNIRILIHELASSDACKLDWDGGDDLCKSIMASKLVFNMLVPEGDDAHFIHLFSGDENRYRVELMAIAEDESEQLIWKGFLLPDQYNEPYKNVNFFVDFTASDMINAMKGKYLEPWVYENEFPVSEVLAMCLKYTGLNQNLIVNPSIVPDGLLYDWTAKKIDLRMFIDGNRYKDCFSIIESICSSSLCTLLNYRGYFWLQGFTRKGEVSFTSMQFDTDGNRINDVINSSIYDDVPLVDGSVTLNAITPWKKVNVNFKSNGDKNFYDDEIVSIQPSKQFKSYYRANGVTSYGVDSEIITLPKIKRWIENLSNNFWVFGVNIPGFEYYLNLVWSYNWTAISSYNYTEAMVMNEYLEAPFKPYVKTNNQYELELEFLADSVQMLDGFIKDDFENNLKNGLYDKLFPFQIFIDDVEKYSNRPSFNTGTDMRFETSMSVGQFDYLNLTFKLKFNFKVDQSGFLKLRFLMPIHQRDLGGVEAFQFNRMYCKVLKLSLVEDYDENLDTIAFRDINYTQEFDYELDITSTIDNSVTNTFGLGYTKNKNYYKTIDRSIDNDDYTGHHYFLPVTILNLTYNRFRCSYDLIKYLFENSKLKTVFIEKVNGVKESMTDLWFGWQSGFYRLGFLKTYTGFPNIPKKYKAYPDVSAEDVLKYMHVEFPNEDYSSRLKWKLYGSSTIYTYPKAIATALHGLQPEMLYRMEATAFGLVFPDVLMNFYFDGKDRKFIPTKMQLDLFANKSTVVATENKYTELTDISYE